MKGLFVKQLERPDLAIEVLFAKLRTMNFSRCSTRFRTILQFDIIVGKITVALGKKFQD